MKKKVQNKKQEIKEFIRNNKFNICIFFIYSIVTLIAILSHECWRDEAQTWLVAEKLGIIDIFKQMRFEGHPALWIYLITPFAKLGFPYLTQRIISWIIMNLTAILILWKSPFKKITKFLILFSSPFIYYYVAIARSYCLIPLALSLIAITYKNRIKKPINYILSITFLLHTHILMAGVACSMYLFFFFEEIIIKFKNKEKKEKKNIIYSLIIAIVSVLLLVIQLFGSIETNDFVSPNFTSDKILLFKEVIKYMSYILTGTESKIILLLFISLIIISLSTIYLKNKKNLFMFCLGISFMFFIWLFVYPVFTDQKMFTVLLSLITFFWIGYSDNKSKKESKLFNFDMCLILMLSINVFVGINAVYKEIKYNYSYSEEAAKFINENIEEDATFITDSVPLTSSIIPYTDKDYKFWSVQTKDYFTYSIWIKELLRIYQIEYYIDLINTQIQDKNNIYFIYCGDFKKEDMPKFLKETNAIELYSSFDKENAISDEYYTIYKLYN